MCVCVRLCVFQTTAAAGARLSLTTLAFVPAVPFPKTAPRNGQPSSSSNASWFLFLTCISIPALPRMAAFIRFSRG
ncbi:hypothetical protein ACQKWADRAFT_287549 [Trichoderma austrokoningii]